MLLDSMEKISVHFAGKSLPERADALQRIIRGFKLSEPEATLMTALIMHPSDTDELQAMARQVELSRAPHKRRVEMNRFDDPEYLSDLSDEVMRSHDAEREELLTQFLPTLSPEQRILYNKLDDLGIHELCDVQSRTVQAMKDSLLSAPTPGALRSVVNSGHQTSMQPLAL